MSLSWVNNSASFANGGAVNVSLAYPNPNAAGNLGVCWLFTSNGLLPSSVTDSNGNTWCLKNSINTNVGGVSVWTCAALNAGANTVSTTFGDSPTSGTPSVHIHEYAYSGPVAVTALQPLWTGTGGVQVATQPLFVEISGGVQATVNLAILMAIYDQGSAHGWLSSAPSVARVGTVEGTRASTISGDSIQNSAFYQYFTCEFDNNAVSPAAYDTIVCALLVTSPAP